MFDNLTNPLALFGGRRPGYNTHRHTSIWLSRLSGECRLIQPRELRGEKALKRRFSELASEAVCNQEDACALEQRLDDEPEPVIAQGEPLVLQHPRVAALNGPAPLAQP